MLVNLDEQLHATARKCAEQLCDPDKKHLRFNDIVATARVFYSDCPEDGIRELVAACDRANPALYDKAVPMWKSLQDNYGWMLCL